MTLLCTVLLLADDSMRPVGGAPMLGAGAAVNVTNHQSSLFQTATPLDQQRWQGIVVHHSGTPAGDAAALHRQHISYGLDGLGYHFVIGNGRGMGDGIIHIGERWDHQHAGAHAIGPDGPWHNQHSIAICLIGNGESGTFTERQLASLAGLTRELARRFDIAPDRILLHRDIADVKSPGQFFPEAAFRERLLGN